MKVALNDIGQGRPHLTVVRVVVAFLGAYDRQPSLTR